MKMRDIRYMTDIRNMLQKEKFFIFFYKYYIYIYIYIYIYRDVNEAGKVRVVALPYLPAG